MKKINVEGYWNVKKVIEKAEVPFVYVVAAEDFTGVFTSKLEALAYADKLNAYSKNGEPYNVDLIKLLGDGEYKSYVELASQWIDDTCTELEDLNYFIYTMLEEE